MRLGWAGWLFGSGIIIREEVGLMVGLLLCRARGLDCCGAGDGWGLD